MPDENAKSSMPIRKVMVGGLAGALSILITWIVSTFIIPGVEIPDGISQSFTVIMTFIVSYFVPSAASE